MDYILSFTPCFLSETAFDFAVLSIESDDNIGSVLPWQQLPIKIMWNTGIHLMVIVPWVVLKDS